MLLLTCGIIAAQQFLWAVRVLPMLQYPRYCTTAVATTKTPTTPTSPTTTVRTYNKPPAVLLPLVIPHNRLPSLALLQCPVAAAAVGREGGKAAEGSLRLAEAEEHHQFLSIWYGTNLGHHQGGRRGVGCSGGSMVQRHLLLYFQLCQCSLPYY